MLYLIQSTYFFFKASEKMNSLAIWRRDGSEATPSPRADVRINRASVSIVSELRMEGRQERESCKWVS